MLNEQIQAVAFDAYGTLCYIADPAHPFASLPARVAAQAMRLCMTHPLDLLELLEGIYPLSPEKAAVIAENVQREVVSVRLFDDVLETLDCLRGQGVRIGLISNLALPYAQPVRSLLGDRIDSYVWSFEVGAIKPEQAIFAALCRQLGTPPNQLLMVGDSRRADVEGAQHFGMPALHLARDGSQRTAQSLIALKDVLVWLDEHTSFRRGTSC